MLYETKMKPYYTRKGRYEDGRNKLCIEFEKNGKVETKFLPKPEKMLQILHLFNYGKKKLEITNVLPQGNTTGKKNKWDQVYMVRNVLFEPTEFEEVDSVNLAMKQIEAAFRWNRPAIVSAHRVNFCGHIDPRNREKGLTALGQLLKRITEKWPDVEFMSSDQLGELMANGN